MQIEVILNMLKKCLFTETVSFAYKKNEERSEFCFK